MSSSMDLGLLKQSIHDLRDSIKNNTQVMRKYSDIINMSNLLKMLELGIISKDDLIETELYKNYISEIISDQKKRSLFK